MAMVDDLRDSRSPAACQFPTFLLRGVELRLAPCPDSARARSSHYLGERLDPAMFFRASRKHYLSLRFIESIDRWA